MVEERIEKRIDAETGKNEKMNTTGFKTEAQEILTWVCVSDKIERKSKE
jgi:hypothetical protein